MRFVSVRVSVTDPGNVELGIHMRYVVEAAQPQLYQMTYAVDGTQAISRCCGIGPWRRRADRFVQRVSP